MAPTSNTKATSSSAIPYLYRFALFYLEPLFATGGVLLALTKPENYVSTMTRRVTTSIDPSTNFIYTELAGTWLYFAFTEAVVLRFIDDLRIWRLLCVGMLLSDIAYCHSCAEAVGGWSVWLVVWKWSIDDWTVTMTTWPFLLVRIAIVLGIGVKDAASDMKKE